MLGINSIKRLANRSEPRVYEIGDTVHWITGRTFYWGEIIAWMDYPDGERKALVSARWFNEYGNVYGGTRLVTEGQVIPPGLFNQMLEAVS